MSLEVEYLTCPKSRHFEELSIVCLEKQCVQNVLICPICEFNDHQGHQVMGLRQFMEQLRTKVDVKEVLDGGLGIQERRKVFLRELSKLRQQFDNSIYQLECKIINYFNQIQQKYAQSFLKRAWTHISSSFQSYSSTGNHQQLSQLISQLKIHSTTPLHQQLQFYSITINNKFTTLSSIISKLNFSSQFSILSKALQIPTKFNFGQCEYQWSTYHSPTIIINGRIATQKNSNTLGERFALIQGKHNKIGDIKIRFKINKLKGWIGIGICLKQSIILSGYKFNYTQPFHGSYLISANGYSWSHSRPEYNSAYKSFIFHQGDTIQIQYSSIDNRVTFQNKLNSSKFLLSTTPIQNGQQGYVACVNLCNAGDQVQILNGE